jgi:hypothetical protein
VALSARWRGFGEQFTINRPGCLVHYWLAGPSNAPLVTLSHAALTDHTFFARQLPPLVDAPIMGFLQRRVLVKN